MFQVVQDIIQNQVRPYLLEHHGDIELVEVNNDVVVIKLLGACNSCPSNRITVKEVIENKLLEELPTLKGVEILSSINPELLEMAKRILNKNQTE